MGQEKLNNRNKTDNKNMPRPSRGNLNGNTYGLQLQRYSNNVMALPLHPHPPPRKDNAKPVGAFFGGGISSSAAPANRAPRLSSHQHHEVHLHKVTYSSMIQ